MANPWEFLDRWTRDHVNATVYDDTATAEILAQECVRDAEKAGIGETSLTKAAGGNLVTHMEMALNSAADQEVERVVNKDRR